MKESALIVMARYPEVGSGKRRLARAIGAEAACRLYRAFLQDIEARFAGGQRTLVWAFHPPDANFEALLTAPARCLPQRGHDLSERMWTMFRTVCNDGFGAVLMIGADVPHVRDEWLDEAEEALAVHDIVLGPADDGGYYLIGMRRAHDLFTGVPMGTDRVLSETLRRAAGSNLRVHLLPRCFDIDEVRDLVQLRALLEGDGCALRLPSTAAVIGDLWATIALD